MTKESGFCEGSEMERVVRLALVTGLPEKVSAELQQVKDAEDVPVADLLDRARVLMAKEHGVVTVGAGAVSGGWKGAVTSGVGTGEVNRSARQGPMKCWECGGPHPVRFCTKKEKIKCYRCGGRILQERVQRKMQ